MRRVVTRSPEETRALGREFARSLAPGDVVALEGTLGTGKTQFVLGACDGFEASGPVSSPTFALINVYSANFGSIVHADLYRIETLAEVAELGLEEYFSSRFICFIEWADRVPGVLPPDALVVRAWHGSSESERVFEMQEAHRR
jgi:tRNA threonylcarbamoyladenosine biosynthesis protein TsaE